MNFSSIYNYIKKIENTIIIQDPPQEQFLNLDLYQSSTFNLKTFSLSIFSKIEDTSSLLSELQLSIEKTKNDIVEQINSNFNNYIALISKLQTIDFLINNINNSLISIKDNINNKMNLIVKYELELKELLEFISSNDKELFKIHRLLKKYENKNKCEQLITKIEKFLKNNLKGIYEKNYTIVRKFLFLLINFYSIKSKVIEEEDNDLVISNSNTIIINGNNYMSFVDDICSTSINKYFSNYNDKLSRELQLNLIGLLYQIFYIQGKEDMIYNKIFDIAIKNEMNKIFDKSNESISKKIKEIDSLMSDEKYTLITNKLNKNRFEQICFLLPFIKRCLNSRNWSNCIDNIAFKENYKSVLKFFEKFDFKGIQNEIANFIGLFSFYTYFQFLQNDIYFKLKDIIDIEETNFDELLILSNMKNSIDSYLAEIKFIFSDGKVFVQNISNFLTLIFQCNILIKKKIIFVETKSELLQVYLNSSIDGIGKSISYEMDSKERKKLDDLSKTIINFREYFKVDGEFTQNIKKVFQKEKFLFTNEEEGEINSNKAIEICNTFFKNFDLNYK